MSTRTRGTIVRTEQHVQPRPEGRGSVAGQVFNSAIAAASIAALDELGLFDELDQRREVSVSVFCETRGLHEMSVHALIYAIACVDVVELGDDDDTVRCGPVFAETFRTKGYFLWLIRGYGGMLRELATVAKDEHRVGDFIDRNGEYIAIAGKDYGAQFVDRDFAEALDAVPFNVAADLGCGSAERLIRLATERPKFRGVGVEFSRNAVDFARSRVEHVGLDDRITIIHRDVKGLQPEEAFVDVDVIFSLFMGHDLWPRTECVRALNGIAEAFPRAARFLLCDTYRSDLPASSAVPVFTLGFEVTHAVMGQYVPSVGEWLDLFRDTAWTCVSHREIDIPFSCIFDLRTDHG